MEVFTNAIEIMQYWIKTNYLSALAIMATAIGIAVFILVDQLLRKGLIYLYGKRIDLFRKSRATGKKKRLPTLAGLQESGLTLSRIATIGGVVLGIVAAVMASDPVLSATFLMCFPVLGYALTLGMNSNSFIARRIQLLALLKMMIDDLEAFQSSQKACFNLLGHYQDITPEDKRDPDLISKLTTISALSSSDQNLNDIVNELFGASEIYKPISDIVNFAAETGPASAVDYAKVVIKKGSMWKTMITALTRQVTGIRFTALVLEFLLIGGVFATFPLSLGEDMSNMLHDYFFASLANKLVLAGIVVAHTIVEYGFMDFLKVNVESI